MISPRVLSMWKTLTGSNINPLTPCPVERTTIVALPYNAYPAATMLRPGCRASLTVAGPSDCWIEKKVNCYKGYSIKNVQGPPLRHLTAPRPLFFLGLSTPPSPLSQISLHPHTLFFAFYRRGYEWQSPLFFFYMRTPDPSFFREGGGLPPCTLFNGILHVNILYTLLFPLMWFYAYLSVYGKNSPNRHKTVNIRRTIQWIKDDYVSTLKINQIKSSTLLYHVPVSFSGAG